MQLNFDYLLDMTARTLLSKIRIYDSKGTQQDVVCPLFALDDHPLFPHDIECLLLNHSGRAPLLAGINSKYCYASLSLNETSYIIGPVKFDFLLHIRNSFEIALEKDTEDALCRSVKTASWKEYCQVLLNFANLPLTASDDTDCNEITEELLIRSNYPEPDFENELRSDAEQIVFHNIEAETFHNPYDQEFRVTSAIENGDLELLKKSIDEPYIGSLGLLADDNLRHLKNTAIVIITIASRAAIRGGLPYETAFTLSDLYIRQVENAVSITEPRQIAHSADYQYAQLVHELKNISPPSPSQGAENIYITNCKNYIFRHLHGRLKVSDIAEEISISVNYLSTIFKKYEGISLSNYILKQKINRVKNMLIYSNYSFLDISNYLGFASQSHMGKHFKQETGLTLKQYRTKYQLQEFME